jgi:type II restriction enzyme
MSIVNYQNLKLQLIGSKVPKPLSGTLSGHAAGEPFDKHVYAELKKEFPQQTFRQYEYLNDLYSKNPKVITLEERLNLFNSPTVMFLLSRGKQATSKWDLENIFEEKQNDTADILVVNKGFYEIIDIKTRNISKKS